MKTHLPSRWFAFQPALLLILAIGAIYAGPELSASSGSEAPHEVYEQVLPTSPARVIETSFHSEALGHDVPYIVYLPPGYDSSPDRRYPVLIMLHGLGASMQAWQSAGLFTSAQELQAAGEIQGMIIVTPEGQNAYWVNHADNGPRWGTYITRDLVNEIDTKYRTLPGRENRAIGGFSMGGHGALQLALNSNAFSVVGAHSVALRRFEERFPFFGDRDYFEAHDPVSLCRKNPDNAKRLRIWIDIGEDDTWMPAASLFHDQLKNSGIAHVWNVFPGGHDVRYWRSHVNDYLIFYSSALESSS